MAKSSWSSDVRISLPRPSRLDLLLTMDGFALTAGGMAHNIDQATYKELGMPTYAPDNFGSEVYDDRDLDDAPAASIEDF